jgi:hypothetical protein
MTLLGCAGARGCAPYRPHNQDNKIPETIMVMHRSLAAVLWLLAAAGAYAAAAQWANDALAGKVHPWVLIVVFWGAAAVSVSIHHLSRYLADHIAPRLDALRGLRSHLARGLPRRAGRRNAAVRAQGSASSGRAVEIGS